MQQNTSTPALVQNACSRCEPRTCDCLIKCPQTVPILYFPLKMARGRKIGAWRPPFENSHQALMFRPHAITETRQEAISISKDLNLATRTSYHCFFRKYDSFSIKTKYTETNELRDVPNLVKSHVWQLQSRIK